MAVLLHSTSHGAQVSSISIKYLACEEVDCPHLISFCVLCRVGPIGCVTVWDA